MCSCMAFKCGAEIKRYGDISAISNDLYLPNDCFFSGKKEIQKYNYLLYFICVIM